MRVLQTLDSLNRGGAETLVLDVCRNVNKFGLDLTFVATGGGELEEDFRDSGTDFIRLQRQLPIDPIVVWKLRKIIKDRKIDIVHGYQPVESVHLYLAAAGLKSVKQVLTYQGFIDGAKNRLAAKFISSRVDANISCGRGLFPWLRDELGLDTSENFFLVSNGVDVERLRPSGVSFRKESGFDNSALLMAMVANFRPDPTKDQMTVCRALPVVLERFEDARFLFVGNVAEGGEENFDECIRYCDDNGIGEKVFFLGGREDVPDILADLDLFVFSSLQEGLPIALMEAIMAGVPTIISDIDPLLEVTGNGKHAGVFRRRDSEELSLRMIELLNNEVTRLRLAKSAKEFALRNYSIEAHFRVLTALYQKLMEGEVTPDGGDGGTKPT